MSENALHERARQALTALREPDHTLVRVVNTIRQSIADVIEELVSESLQNRHDAARALIKWGDWQTHAENLEATIDRLTCERDWHKSEHERYMARCLNFASNLELSEGAREAAEAKEAELWNVLVEAQNHIQRQQDREIRDCCLLDKDGNPGLTAMHKAARPYIKDRADLLERIDRAFSSEVKP